MGEVKRLLVLPLLALILIACGGSSQSDPACQGLPTAKHTRTALVLFGALDKLDKRSLCANLGRPTSVRQLSRGRQLWRYGDNTFTLRKGHVIASRGPAVSSKSGNQPVQGPALNGH